MAKKELIRLDKKHANQIVKKVKTAVSEWKGVVTNIGISKAEPDRMRKAL